MVEAGTGVPLAMGWVPDPALLTGLKAIVRWVQRPAMARRQRVFVDGVVCHVDC